MFSKTKYHRELQDNALNDDIVASTSEVHIPLYSN
jgi:hypothetical protein